MPIKTVLLLPFFLKDPVDYPAFASSKHDSLRYSFDLLKSQLLKATKRRDPDGVPLNGRIPRSNFLKLNGTDDALHSIYCQSASVVSFLRQLYPLSFF